eukprot:TRINITY_DN7723_c0_g7_i1.p1 TRINITY_DN7723_c0_g7~~TRINITY_DN7723_c0_g7_i1.p1  ORF type:complete len:335 (+),score=42.22 TRINITY_DN7723_c0_g7_i1:92-1096(+)
MAAAQQAFERARRALYDPSLLDELPSLIRTLDRCGEHGVARRVECDYRLKMQQLHLGHQAKGQPQLLLPKPLIPPPGVPLGTGMTDMEPWELPGVPSPTGDTPPGPEVTVFSVQRWDQYHPIGWSVQEDEMRITKVLPDRPADNAGLQEGMIVTAVEGRPVHSVEAMEKVIADLSEFKVSVELGRLEGRQGESPLRFVRNEALSVSFWWNIATGATSWENSAAEGQVPAGETGSQHVERQWSWSLPSSSSPRSSPPLGQPTLMPQHASPSSSSSNKGIGGAAAEAGRSDSPGGGCRSPLLAPAAPRCRSVSKIARCLRCCRSCPCDRDSSDSGE